MSIKWDSTEPMTGVEVRTIRRLLDTGKIQDGETLTPSDVGDHLGCTHRRQSHGGACLACLPDPEREPGVLPPKAAPRLMGTQEHPKFGDGLRAWGADRPSEWSNAVRRAQFRAGLVPDGLWGPRCVAAGLRKPLALRLRSLWRWLLRTWQQKGLDR